MAYDDGMEVWSGAREKARALISAEPELIGSLPAPEVVTALSTPNLSLSEISEVFFEKYAGRPALGERAYDIEVNAQGRRQIVYRPEFSTISYSELAEQRLALANSLISAPFSIRPGDFVTTLGFASIDYMTIDFACTHVGAVMVALQTNMSNDLLGAIVAETKSRLIIASIDHLSKAISIARTSSLVSHVLLMDYEPRDEGQQEQYRRALNEAASADIPVLLLDDLMMTGRSLPSAPPFVPDGRENTLWTLIYTSGSTGVPKGGMQMSDVAKFYWQGWDGVIADFPVIRLCYQPLNHAMGRYAAISALVRGGTCYFIAKSDMSTLLEDYSIVRPTILDLVPRVAEMIYDQYNSQYSRGRATESGSDEDLRASIMQELRTVTFGGRVLTATISGAPTTRTVMTFIEECFQIELLEVFGASDAGVFAINGRIVKSAVPEYKLLDVPELGYSTKDQPFPRGELLIKPALTYPGYFKQTENPAGNRDAEGFLATGDIVEEIGPGHIAFRDRRNNVVKLAQGEFVAIAKLEAIFSRADPLIHQVYIYADSARSFVLGVVVPDFAVLKERFPETPSDDELRTIVRQKLTEIAQKENLATYELPRDFLIEGEPFTIANTLLTSLGKYSRPALSAKYSERLEALYSEIEKRQRDELESLRQTDARKDVAGALLRAVGVVLGVRDIRLEQSFLDVGGDSLTAVSLTLLIEESFGVTLDVGTILSPSANLGGLARKLAALMDGDDEGPTFGSVHGAYAATVFASDLSLDKFVDSKVLEDTRRDVSDEIRHVLLTGATGFLGHILLLEWLERLAPVGGRVTCIVRANTLETAMRRTEEAFDTGDGELLARFKKLAAGHLDFVIGDLGSPKLGLDEAQWGRLAEQVDLIAHSAALVNHVLDYRQLFGPNVVGTGNLIELAITRRLKRFSYISTGAVPFLAEGALPEEGDDIRTAIPGCMISEGYANGYSVSKWASEVLLRNAHEQLGMPLNIFRAGMLLAHSRYEGQINRSDTFSRLLFSLLATKLAPRSFYSPVADQGRSFAHYDGLPVDFAAASIVAIDLDARRGAGTYHVSNSHYDDGISLDTIVDWLIEAGHELNRIPTFENWFARFKAALESLPEPARKQSSLGVLEQFRHPANASELPWSTKEYDSKVIELKPGQWRSIPQLSRTFVEKCLRDLRLV